MNASRYLFLPLLCTVVLSGCGASNSSETKIPPAAKAPNYQVFNLENSPRSAGAIGAFKNGDYLSAANQAAVAVDADPTDMVARFIYGASLAAIGDFEHGRKQLSLAIAWHPRVAEAYIRRAVCAANMGDLRRADADMAIARQLDPKGSDGLQAEAEKIIDQARKNRTSADPTALNKKLFQAADRGEAYATLQSIADELVRAANAQRFIGDETYSENCRKLDWSLAESPDDPDRLFRFGRFLLDELEVQKHHVGSVLNPDAYRMQGRLLWKAEIERARGYLQHALQINPNHVGALVGMGRLELRLTQYANAENYLRRAMAVGEPDPEVLYMMRTISAVGAGQHMAISWALTQTITWTERRGGYVYKYTRSPTAEGIRQARLHDKSANRLLHSAVDYRNAVLDLYPDDARTHDYIGVLAREYEDYATAAQAWEKALELDPGNHQVSYSLAEVYARQNRVDDYLRQATKTWTDGRHTSAAHDLRWAWEKINVQQWSEAEAALDNASKVDAADTRTLAYLGVMAEARGDKKKAKSYYKAAFALEEAHARQRGASYINGSGRWNPNDMGLALELRMRLGILSEDEGNPGDALKQYQGIYSLEKMISDRALDDDLYTALLPVPGANPHTREHAPRWGEYMRTSRALAGYLFYKNGRIREAEEHFRMLRDYEKRMSAAGIKAGRYLSDTVWKSQPVAEAAYAIFRRQNDQSQVYWWERETRKYRPPSTGDWRRNEPRFAPEASSQGKLKARM